MEQKNSRRNKESKAEVDLELKNLRRSFMDSVKNLARSGPGIDYIIVGVPKTNPDGTFIKTWEMRESDFVKAETEVKKLQSILNKIKIIFGTDMLRIEENTENAE